jgi:hypothetical protein
MQCINTWPL